LPHRADPRSPAALAARPAMPHRAYLRPPAALAARASPPPTW